MADEPLEPLPPAVIAAFTKALQERSDKEIQNIQRLHDLAIKDFKQLTQDIINLKLKNARTADYPNIVKEQNLYRETRLAEMNRDNYLTIWHKQNDFPLELSRYLKEQQEAQKILKNLQEQSDKETLKPDQPRR